MRKTEGVKCTVRGKVDSRKRTRWVRWRGRFRRRDGASEQVRPSREWSWVDRRRLLRVESGRKVVISVAEAVNK